jgi:hypothetical protein
VSWNWNFLYMVDLDKASSVTQICLHNDIDWTQRELFSIVTLARILYKMISTYYPFSTRNVCQINDMQTYSLIQSFWESRICISWPPNCCIWIGILVRFRPWHISRHKIILSSSCLSVSLSSPLPRKKGIYFCVVLLWYHRSNLSSIGVQWDSVVTLIWFIFLPMPTFLFLSFPSNRIDIDTEI